MKVIIEVKFAGQGITKEYNPLAPLPRIRERITLGEHTGYVTMIHHVQSFSTHRIIIHA